MPRIRSCIAGAVALVAVSCQDHSSPIAAPTPISAQFLDAMHGGGNPHFFLLPPFVSTPDLTKETFESGLKPSVRITEMTADGQAFAACTNEQIAYLPASEFTQLKAYAAFWRPANYSNVAAPCIYRLQVEVLGTKASPGPVLGFADVQVISKTTIKYLKTGEYIPLPKDLILPFWFFIGQGAVFYAQSGGTDACRVDRDCVEAVVNPLKDNVVVTKQQEAGISIPAGAFAAPITLVIEQQTGRPCIMPSKLGLPQFADNGTGCYRYQRFPSDVKQILNLTVAMCVEIGLLTHEQADRLQIFRFDPDEDGGAATALQNAPAAFLPCEITRFGLVPRFLNDLAALVGPQVLHAAAIHLGVGGSCGVGKCLSSPYFTWGMPGTVTKNSADAQTAAAGAAVVAPPSVVVMDLGNPTLEIPPQPIANATVIFQVTAGGGSIATPSGGTGGATDTLTTDANGVATLGRWTLGATPGTNNVSAVIGGAVDTATFTATATSPPDLVISSTLTASFLEVFPGDRIQLSAWTLTNQGGDLNSASGLVRNGFYLSTDSTLTTTDVFLDDNFNTNGNVRAGQSFQWGAPTLTVPLNTAPGTYYIGIFVDDLNEAAETNESNNFQSVKITVLSGPS